MSTPNTEPLVTETKPLSYYMKNALWHFGQAPDPITGQVVPKSTVESWLESVKKLEADRAELIRQRQWISVEEELPVETFRGLCPATLVLCCGRSGNRFTALFADGYFANPDGTDCEEVIAWMPLPEPPQPR